MISRVSTVAFQGIEGVAVDVQVMISPGKVGIQIVGLPDKAVAESRERIQAALYACGLALPAKRITVNLAPADLPKEGSHFDLPIILALMSSIQALPSESLAHYLALGELHLDGSLGPINGVLPAAICAKNLNKGLICPKSCGSEAAWANEHLDILAPDTLIELTNHFRKTQILSRPQPAKRSQNLTLSDLSDIKGQKAAKRALEIAAAGGHNLLMMGPPGSGKSLLASRLPSILPPLSTAELLEVAAIHSMAGQLSHEQNLSQYRPFRSPHHSATMAALVGGGTRVRPGEVSLAHNGVLFMDEFPEFSPQALNALRQPLETGECIIARANRSVRYPARIQLVTAMNPCRCGMAGEGDTSCIRGPRCAIDYQARISGPLLDRIDIRIEMPAVSTTDLLMPSNAESSQSVAERILKARQYQQQRMEKMGISSVTNNAHCSVALIEQIAVPDSQGVLLLNEAAEKMHFSARGYHRILKVARTIADLDQSEIVKSIHLAEAIAYRIPSESFTKIA
ncbi:MG(2+) Chelatase Family Protein / ComM-related protein [Liberibacter crescens BT-1]|uniref:MG(2+) Chelatase Family Protein / ComM-related protein n=1 Tax=Liberibacter crescens (strain BT-1) TaxID=1215343 RepID=L0EV74_LIBCB|nr:YifB family Mg chelatase-like AAA ATPase [Liberibacter crescens]AGA64538.1 MG(2+) Chelatase Family Protein / ComM-related protein [Liberibacter crescens BT-1]AMC12688.1 ATPase AAA [Liberibacter crescens]